MPKHSGKARQRELFLAALLSGASVAQAAEQACISERTAFRWLEDAEFQAEYQRAKRNLVDTATNRLLRSMDKAAAKLESVMDDPKTPQGLQIAAATRILDRGRWAHENDDLAVRIAALEEDEKHRGE